MNRRTLWICGAVFAALLLLLAWSHERLVAARGRAQDAATQRATSRDHARRIERLRQAPAVAGRQRMRSTELAARVEQAAQDARLDPKRILRIDPQPPRRVAEGPYLIAGTSIELRAVPMPRLIRFFHTLTEGPGGLRVSTLRLTAPRNSSGSELWNAEATIDHLIYRPTQPDTRS